MLFGRLLKAAKAALLGVVDRAVLPYGLFAQDEFRPAIWADVDDCPKGQAKGQFETMVICKGMSKTIMHGRVKQARPRDSNIYITIYPEYLFHS